MLLCLSRLRNPGGANKGGEGSALVGGGRGGGRDCGSCRCVCDFLNEGSTGISLISFFLLLENQPKLPVFLLLLLLLLLLRAASSLCTLAEDSDDVASSRLPGEEHRRLGTWRRSVALVVAPEVTSV
jgi:hypothetical protein